MIVDPLDSEDSVPPCLAQSLSRASACWSWRLESAVCDEEKSGMASSLSTPGGSHSCVVSSCRPCRGLGVGCEAVSLESSRHRRLLDRSVAVTSDFSGRSSTVSLAVGKTQMNCLWSRSRTKRTPQQPQQQPHDAQQRQCKSRNCSSVKQRCSMTNPHRVPRGYHGPSSCVSASVRRTLLLLTCLLVFTTSNVALVAAQKYLFLPIPPFQVRLIFPPTSNDDNLDLSAMKRDLIDLTSHFLEERIDADLVQNSDMYKGLLHRVDLTADLLKLDTDEDPSSGSDSIMNYLTIRAIFTDGCRAVFHDDNEQEMSVEEQTLAHTDLLRSIVDDSFSGSYIYQYLVKIEQSSNDLLSTIDDIEVRTNLDEVGTVTGNGPITAQEDNSESGIGKSETIILSLLAVFLVAFFGGAYIYLSKQYHRRRAHKPHFRKASIRHRHHHESYLSSGHELVDVTFDVNDSFDLDDGAVEAGAISSEKEERGEQQKQQQQQQEQDTHHRRTSSGTTMLELVAASTPTHLNAKDEKEGTGPSNQKDQNNVIVPVPARKDELDSLCVKGGGSPFAQTSRKKTGSDIPVSRRYVQPASPFDVLYGAAFLHQEHESVARGINPNTSRQQEDPARKWKKNKGQPNVIGRKSLITPRESYKPHMSSIAEEGEMSPYLGGAGSVGDNEYNADYGWRKGGRRSPPPPPPPSSLTPSSVSIWGQTSGYLKKLFDTDNSTRVSGGGGGVPESSLDAAGDAANPIVSKDDNLVFRDFPRHDGTPCLMYTPKDAKSPPSLEIERTNFIIGSLDDDDDDGDESGDFAAAATITIDGNDCTVMSVNGGGSNLDVSPGDDENDDFESPFDHSSVFANIDQFVDKLERLMAIRARQVEERVAMERERVARRKERQEQRRREKAGILTENDKNTGNDGRRGRSPSGAYDIRKSEAPRAVDVDEKKSEDGDNTTTEQTVLLRKEVNMQVDLLDTPSPVEQKSSTILQDLGSDADPGDLSRKRENDVQVTNTVDLLDQPPADLAKPVKSEKSKVVGAALSENKKSLPQETTPSDAAADEAAEKEHSSPKSTKAKISQSSSPTSVAQLSALGLNRSEKPFDEEGSDGADKTVHEGNFSNGGVWT